MSDGQLSQPAPKMVPCNGRIGGQRCPVAIPAVKPSGLCYGCERTKEVNNGKA
jgi:hypothetical protein